MRICQFLVVLALIASTGSAFGQQGAQGVVAAWTFDDGTANDVLGVNNGIIHGGVKFSEGKSGLAADLDGIFGWIEVPDNASLEPLEEAVSITAWIFVRDTGRSAGIWKGWKVEDGPNDLFKITYADTNEVGRMGWGGNNGVDVEGRFSSEEEYKDQWLHVAQVMDGETIQAYVDYEPVDAIMAFDGVDSNEPKNLQGPYDWFKGEPIRIGMALGVAGVLNNKTYLNGLIDELGLWARGLSQEEVRQAGQDLRLFLGVSPAGKLATSWGAVKAARR